MGKYEGRRNVIGLVVRKGLQLEVVRTNDRILKMGITDRGIKVKVIQVYAS
ncbi:unnamed protein product, partial [Timema podura]|nr:unnamed protein product [Timema podura]